MWVNVQCVDSVLGMQALCPMLEITEQCGEHTSRANQNGKQRGQSASVVPADPRMLVVCSLGEEIQSGRVERERARISTEISEYRDR